MKKFSLLLTIAAASAACEGTPTTSPVLLPELAASRPENSSCANVAGTLTLWIAGSDGTHTFFEGEIEGDLQGAYAETIAVTEPPVAQPAVMHMAGTSEWTITGSRTPALVGRVLRFSVRGLAVQAGELGRAFLYTLVGGARSGSIVQQEPHPDVFPYHGVICP